MFLDLFQTAFLLKQVKFCNEYYIENKRKFAVYLIDDLEMVSFIRSVLVIIKR